MKRLDDQFASCRADLLIEEAPPQHLGFGSKTSLLLASLVAVTSANQIAADRATLQQISGRGGTSGVGINTFFDGGFVADAGHLKSSVGGFSPSSSRTPLSPPPLVASHNSPPDWIVTLALPSTSQTEGTREKDFFQSNTPLPAEEALRTLALTYHGVLPAVVEADIAALAPAVREMQNVGFKKREVDAQLPNVRSLLNDLGDVGLAAGMSSMGPLIFVLDRRGHSSTIRNTDASVQILGEFHIPEFGHEVVADA